MLFRIAWRNIWRHHARSLVVITAIALGLWAGVFATAFVQGMMKQKIDSVIKMEMSHFQIHHPDFRKDKLSKYFIEDGIEIQQYIGSFDSVEAVSARVVLMSMMGSANKSCWIKVTGISPSDEAGVTGLNQKVVEGVYFEGAGKNPILISKKLADQFKVGVRSKLILTFQDIHNNITAATFRVVGIFDTGNGMYDEQNVFVMQADIQALLKIGSGVHQIAVLLKDHGLAEPMAARFQAEFSNLEVMPWQDLATGMRFMVQALDTYLYFIVGIILIALLFSVVNTMLMAILERTREIGMLMAIGMAKQRVFFMILLETVFLSLIGGPVGLAISVVSIGCFGKHGIDLAGAAYGDMGFATVIYPYLDNASYGEVSVMVLVMAIMAAIYPAIKALLLNPAEAIRKI